MHKHKYCPYKYGCNTIETFIVYQINSTLLGLVEQWGQDVRIGDD